MCGEYVWDTSGKSNLLGSPPRVWGIHAAYQLGKGNPIITTTCVGNTLKESRDINNYFLLYS